MSISTVANLDVYGSSMSYDLTFIADSIQHFEPKKPIINEMLLVIFYWTLSIFL
jgi:hypothetical protein